MSWTGSGGDQRSIKAGGYEGWAGVEGSTLTLALSYSAELTTWLSFAE